jgi:hypothetical protein
MPTLQISLIEILLLVAIIFILIASGLAFYDGAPTLISGLIGLVGLVLFVVALVAGWRDHFRPASRPQPRGEPLGPRRAQRGPFSAWAEQIRIQRLREEYRRAQEHRDELDD